MMCAVASLKGLLTPPKDIPKDILKTNQLKDIPKDIPSGGWGDTYVDEAVKALLKSWREFDAVTDYTANDLHRIGDEDGNIRKAWVPIPWYSREIGRFLLREITFIHAVGVRRLDPETKDELRRKAVAVRYPDSRRLHEASTTFIFCLNKGDTRATLRPPAYCYFIEKGPMAGYQFFTLLANGLEEFVEGIASGLPRVYQTTERVLELDRAFINQLRALQKDEITKMNAIGRATGKKIGYLLPPEAFIKVKEAARGCESSGPLPP